MVPRRDADALASAVYFDPHAEAQVLGAILSAVTEQAIPQLDPGDFCGPNNATIYRAIRAAVEAGEPPTPTFVRLRLPERLRDGLALELLAERCEGLAFTPRYLDAFRKAADKRHVAEAMSAAQIKLATDADADIDDVRAAVDAAFERRATLGASNGLLPGEVDLGPILRREVIVSPPEFLKRGQICLLHRGRLNRIYGAGGIGKSLFATYAAREAMAAEAHRALMGERGEPVMWLATEGDPAETVERLKLLGVPDELLDGENKLFHYFGVEGLLDRQYMALVLRRAEQLNVGMIVLDATDGFVTGLGFDPDKVGGVELFYAWAGRLARLPSRPCVLLVDHIGHEDPNVKTRGAKHSRGSSRKSQGVDGASFQLRPVQPFGRGVDGHAELLLERDRSGFLLAHARGTDQVIAVMVVATDPDDGQLVIGLYPPDPERAAGGLRPDHAMRELFTLIRTASEPMNVSELGGATVFRAETVGKSLSRLEFEGYITHDKGPHNSKLFRALVDTFPDPELEARRVAAES